jgi:outer membrane biosynthesis protein TonB
MNEHRPAPPPNVPGQPHHPPHPAAPHAPHAPHPAHPPHPQHGQPPRPVPTAVLQPRIASGVAPVRSISDHDPHRDSIALDDEPAPSPTGILPSSKIKVQGLGLSSGIGAGPATQFKRKPHVSGLGACRVRSFHGRLSDEGLAFMDGKINEWLDAHPEIEIKNVTTTVGMYDGKIKEEALVVNVWY